MVVYLQSIIFQTFLHFLVNHLVKALSVFINFSTLICSNFLSLFLGLCTHFEVWTWTWHFYCLHIAFPLELIKIFYERLYCVGCIIKVVLGRYRLQRWNHSDAECSFCASLELLMLHNAYFKV